MGKAKRGKLSRGARHDPVGVPPSSAPTSAAAAAAAGGAAGAAGAKAERAHVLLQEVRGPR